MYRFIKCFFKLILLMCFLPLWATLLLRCRIWVTRRRTSDPQCVPSRPRAALGWVPLSPVGPCSSSPPSWRAALGTINWGRPCGWWQISCGMRLTLGPEWKKWKWGSSLSVRRQKELLQRRDWACCPLSYSELFNLACWIKTWGLWKAAGKRHEMWWLWLLEEDIYVEAVVELPDLSRGSLKVIITSGHEKTEPFSSSSTFLKEHDLQTWRRKINIAAEKVKATFMVLLGRAVKERLGFHAEHKRCQKTKDGQKL